MYFNFVRYLRSLVELLLPYLVPENRITAPKANTLIRELVAMVMLKTGIDLLAAPDFINLLIRMLVDPETMKVSEPMIDLWICSHQMKITLFFLFSDW